MTNYIQTFALLNVLWAMWPGFILQTQGAEYFVSKRGADTNAGTNREEAFASIQKGVDALEPGDTLTIAPGEYFEAVKRADLGQLDKEITIRAEIPGTVTLRGDVPAPEFRRLAGRRFVYVADYNFAGSIPAVNEIDSLTILKRMPNIAELDFIPGTFYHDAQAGKLYISTSDMQPVETHRYSVSVLPTHGVLLIRPRRVVLKGLTVTGFSAMDLLSYREGTSGGVWGIFIVSGKNCVIRDCLAYMNAWGIGIHSGPPGSGDNVVERCNAWGNKSPFANGDMGGLTIFAARRDTIRHSTAYLNGMYGINIYGTGGAPPNYQDDGGNEPENKSTLENNYAWGNETADIKIKTGYEYHHVARNCVAPGLWSVTNITQSTIGRSTSTKSTARDNILLNELPSLDPTAEFADADNRDFRLQATSQFRGTGINGADRGAHAFSPNIFYVRPDGDDQADGLSIAKAWKSLKRAAQNLHAGDMLYLEPGEYSEDVEIRANGEANAAISIRGRGKVPARLTGSVRIKHSRQLKLERLSFRNEITAENCDNLSFDNCEFITPRTALQAKGVHALSVSHCTFADFQQAALTLDGCSETDMRGNLFNNQVGSAVKLSDLKQIRYSNYNSYREPHLPWEVNGKSWTLSNVQQHHDQQSIVKTPEFELTRTAAKLLNASSFTALGPAGKPIGCYRDESRRKELRLVAKPAIFSVSATTANLEWITSLPATCRLAWGETPECERSLTYNVNCFGTYSLTDLKPGQTYYFRIRSIETPQDILPKTELKSVTFDDAPISFTTLVRDADPQVFYVALDGDDSQSGLDRQHAWRSIQHAANKVKVGDTVLVAGGKYYERIRLRVTGETGKPITFRSLSGERVELNGHDMTLNSCFVAAGKSHLRFDGFYLSKFNLFPNDSWSLMNSGEFQLYLGKDIHITRCFSEGRGGSAAVPVAAYYVEDLLIKNCVNTYKFGGMYFWRCPNLRVENTVFAEPMIMAFVLRNEKHQKATMTNCIFTDMLDKKARLNLGILCCDGAIDGFSVRKSCYFLRDCIPLEKRALQGQLTISQLDKHITDAVFADPQFAGDPGIKDNPQDKTGFSPDRMMDASLPLDFSSFFATNPELIKQDIGLQREAFLELPVENGRSQRNNR